MSIEQMIEDLRGSLLAPEDINARVLGNPERAATAVAAGVQGYVIPYRDINDKPIPFYRVKCFDSLPKYKQVKNTGNHVYFPKGVKNLALQRKYVIITEGEKKAASATKAGFPAIAFGGVDSWKNRTLILPEDVELTHVHGKDNLAVKLPAGSDDLQETNESNLAIGMQDFIDLCVSNKLTVVIIYDSDKEGVTFEVQRAAATLGFELRFRGLPLLAVKQLILPNEAQRDKVGLDDTLAQTDGIEIFGTQLKAVLAGRNNFPKHPNIREFVNRKLQKIKLTRKESQQVSLAVLCELDSIGSRLRSTEGDELYYFSAQTKKLMRASLKRSNSDALVDSEFGRFIYQEFGINHSDSRIISWLATQFTSEEPIDTVSPNKVVTTRGDSVYYQINDGQYIAISPDKNKPWEIRDNGAGGVLFESGKVQPIKADDLDNALKAASDKPIKPLWADVLKEVRLKKSADGRMADLICLLYYLSPYLNRWRGTQLPVEMIVGEPGSGKSSLYELRLNIILGSPSLRNAPQDLRDWQASVGTAGGLHVTDNVQMVDKQLKQRLSDEMCRVVTEPNPHIEMRKLYTEADLVRIPVQCIFALTAVQQPFRNADLIQRSLVIELDKGDESVEYDSSWSSDQLSRHGGRTEWLAHQLWVLHRFLARVGKEWDPKYKAKHRLINVEQSLVLMAKTLGMDSDWIPDYLSKITTQAVSESDWALQGLSEFANILRNTKQNVKPFSAGDIVGWAQGNDDYNMCNQLNNARSLGRYMQANKQMLAMIAGIKEAGSSNNKQLYQAFKL